MKLLLSMMALGLVGCGNYLPVPTICQISTYASPVYVHSFGDSTTNGFGADNYCDGYQAIFTNDIGASSDNQALVGSMFVDSPNSVTSNYTSINGFLTTGFSNHTEDINTVLPGFNDVKNFGADQDHLNLFSTELYNSLFSLAKHGHMTLVGTTTYMSDYMMTYYPEATRANVDLYVGVIKSVVSELNAEKLPIFLVDVNAAYDPNTMSTQNTHPNNEGHQVIAALFLKTYLENK